jgi:hypothetical protein
VLASEENNNLLKIMHMIMKHNCTYSEKGVNGYYLHTLYISIINYILIKYINAVHETVTLTDLTNVKIIKAADQELN